MHAYLQIVSETSEINHVVLLVVVPIVLHIETSIRKQGDVIGQCWCGHIDLLASGEMTIQKIARHTQSTSTRNSLGSNNLQGQESGKNTSPKKNRTQNNNLLLCNVS